MGEKADLVFGKFDFVIDNQTHLLTLNPIFPIVFLAATDRNMRII